jgi:hypothetical protein
VCGSFISIHIFDRAEKETKTVSLEENLITLQDVYVHVRTYVIGKRAGSSVSAVNIL